MTNGRVGSAAAATTIAAATATAATTATTTTTATATVVGTLTIDELLAVAEEEYADEQIGEDCGMVQTDPNPNPAPNL
jgi:hypothetical protein